MTVTEARVRHDGATVDTVLHVIYDEVRRRADGGESSCTFYDATESLLLDAADRLRADGFAVEEDWVGPDDDDDDEQLDYDPDWDELGEPVALAGLHVSWDREEDR